MAIFPDGKFKPVERYKPGHSSASTMSSPKRLVYHTAVWDLGSMFDYFNVDGRATPHFFLMEDGTVEQYIDTSIESSADLNGDHNIISVESWDDKKIRPWTAGQVEGAAKIAAWCNKEHGIPLVRLHNSRPDNSGIGWHRLGIPPSEGGAFTEAAGQLLGGVVPGGEIWTLSPGKQCPGDPKIRGIVEDIIPRAIEIANGDDMSEEDVKAINQHTDDAIKRVIEVINARAAGQREFIVRRLATIRTAVDRNASPAEVKELLDKLEEGLDDDDRSGRGGEVRTAEAGPATTRVPVVDPPDRATVPDSPDEDPPPAAEEFPPFTDATPDVVDGERDPNP